MNRPTQQLIGALALGLGLAAGAAHADAPRLYVGGGFGDTTLDTAGDEASLGTVSVKLGVQLLPFFSVELDAGVASDDSGSIVSEPVLNYQAVIGRLGYTFDRTMVYAFGGQARVETDLGTLYGDEFGTDNETVNLFGAGLNLFGNETTAINFEFRYFDEGDLTTAHIGVQHYFGGFR